MSSKPFSGRKSIKQFCIIIAISFVGEILNKIVPLPIPASIYGIVILFTLLCTKVIKVSDVKEVSKFLIEIMPIMFVPPAAGLLETWGIVQTGLWQYLLLTVVSTVVVMIVSGLVTQLVIKSGRKRENKDG